MRVEHSTNTIEAKDVSFSYGTQAVLHGITFSVERGEYLGIVGPNGGGKTTLVKIILGLLKPTAGTMTVFGESTVHSRKHGHIGYVPQRAGQIDRMFPATVEEIVRSGRFGKIGPLRRFREEDERAVKNAMEIAGVSSLQDRSIGALSGGERQKVFIARALAGEAEVLILDEPISGVDVASQEQFFSFLRDLNQKQNLTVFLVSHDIETIVQEATSILCINRELVCHASPEEFIASGMLERLHHGKKARMLAHDHPH